MIVHNKNTKFSYSIFKAIIVVMSFILSISTNFIDSGMYNTAVIILMILFMCCNFIQKKNLLISKRLSIVMIIVMCMLLYNYMLSPLATKKLLIYISCFLMGFLLYKDQDHKALRGLLLGYSIILTISGLFGVVEIFTGNIFDAYTIRVYGAVQRLHSFFLHPIIFSLMMLQAFVINHYLISNKILRTILTMINFWCIFMSLSRSSWLVLAVTIILMILQRKYTQKKPLLCIKYITKRRVFETIIILLLVFYILQNINFVPYITALIIRWQELEGSTSILYRSDVISTVLQDRLNDSNVFHWVIGGGYHSIQNSIGNAGIYFGTVGNNVVDNEWITIFYDFGLIGLFGMIYFFMKSIKIFFQSHEVEMWIVSLCIVVNFLMAFICDTFGWATAGNIVFVLLGIVFSAKNKNRSKYEVNYENFSDHSC